MGKIIYNNFAPEATELAQNGWSTVDQFKSKNKIIEHNGLKYEIVSKATKTSQAKRIAFIFLSILIVPLISKDFRKLVFKGRESIHHAIPHCDAEQTKKMDDLIRNVWTPNVQKNDSKAENESRMWKNAAKAIKEHAQEDGYAYRAPKEPVSYLQGIKDKYNEIAYGLNVNFQNVLPNIELFQKIESHDEITFSHTEAAAQGHHRATMEDAHFSKKISQGTLSGVFDGHGGKEIAEYACKAFENRFEKALEKSNGDVMEAFESLFSAIQHEVAKCEPLYGMGSTAVVTFIDPKTNIIYTATLGDSEANIYRMIDGKMQSIPLSCVRDWTSQKDAQRAAIALNNPSIATDWPKAEDSKHVRFQGINVARAFGDINAGYLLAGPGMTHKPKITMNKLEKGDVIILACDGLKDYVPESVIAEKVATHKANPSANLAQDLVNYAIDPTGADAYDNVTVLALQA